MYAATSLEEQRQKDHDHDAEDDRVGQEFDETVEGILLGVDVHFAVFMSVVSHYRIAPRSQNVVLTLG
jgi:hypothetical protein